MAESFVGEIRMFGGNFAPAGWAFCDGQPLLIADYDALWQLIGTTYGGDGEVTFNLPDLRGRVPLHQSSGPGNTFVLGEAAGVESVTLTVAQIPAHTHALHASTNQGGTTNPPTNVHAQIPGGGSMYIEDTPSVALNTATLLPTGGSQAHENLQPFLGISFIISLFGAIPQRN